MRPHPDLADRRPPREAALGPVRLTPLDPAAAEEDFAAVTGSARVLTGLFGGDWPQGLTLEDDRIDLAWHEREFTLGRSLSWILRDAAGTYLGCAYVFPEPGASGRGEVFLWLVDRPDRLELLATIRPLLEDWLAPWLPAGAAYAWHMNDRA
jgi:hypothetical protein